MAALLFGLIWIVFLPAWLVVIILYQAHVILSSRKLGVSATALGPMSIGWLLHQNDKGKATAVIHHIAGLPDSEGKKLKNE